MRTETPPDRLVVGFPMTPKGACGIAAGLLQIRCRVSREKPMGGKAPEVETGGPR